MYFLNSAFPASPGPLVDFVKKVSSFYHQQRKLTHPVVVHCVPGVGKTGVFCVLAAAMEEISKGHEIPDLTQVRIKDDMIFVYDKMYFLTLSIFFGEL